MLFRDITPLLADPLAFRYSIDELCVHAARRDASAIVGIESRGFVFGAAMADRMRLPFVPLRKPGKLPAARMSIEYSLEYGDSQLDIHEDALSVGERAYVVDDLLAADRRDTPVGEHLAEVVRAGQRLRHREQFVLGAGQVTLGLYDGNQRVGVAADPVGGHRRGLPGSPEQPG